MPSEQRLHPATLLFDLAAHLKRFALPAVLVLFGMSRSSGGPGGMFGRAPAGWEVWLLVFFIPATLISIFRYITFRLRYEEQELVIRSGLFFRTERHIPFSRIQNVDAIQNAVHRLLGVVEVRVETGGGKEEEARLSVLPLSALEEMRRRVFNEHSLTRRGETSVSPSGGETLLHLSPRELLLFGVLENRGMVLIAAATGAAWESGVLNRVTDLFFGGLFSRTYFRELATTFFAGGPFPWLRLIVFIAAFFALLLFVRIVSMIWAFVRLYDFRVTRIGEDLRSEYGLITRVAATVPIRRVQAITISADPLHRLLKRATVRVATAGGAGAKQGNRSASNVREWLAPLIHEEALPHLLQHVSPGFDLNAVTWQPVHPRAFRRAVKPTLVMSVVVSLAASFAIGWAAIGLLSFMVTVSIIVERQNVKHLGWAHDDEVVMMRSGWLSQQITVARVNKIQAVTMGQTPFDRRAAMASVRVDTAGTGALSHRIAIPYLDHQVASGLAARLSAAAANTAFRW